MWERVLIFSLWALITEAKVLSMDMCADQWVLDHYDAYDISAVTHLSKDRTKGLYHFGTTEEILWLKPSVIVSEFPLSSKQQYALRKQKISFNVLPPLKTLDDFYKRFPKEKRALLPSIGKGKKVLILTQNFHTPGRDTFWHDVLGALGFINLTATVDIKGWGYLSGEKILALRPDFLIIFGKETTVPLCLGHIPVKYIQKDAYLCPSPKGLQTIVETLK